jgi:predicted nucleotidyltransferase component of viral defense system
MVKKEKSILSFHQRQFLNLISKEKYFSQKFYLTGGTALSEFYLRHRISEDLDFFCENEEVNSIYIARFIKLKSIFLELEKFDTRRIFGIYSYFFTFKDKGILKVDFSYYPFERIEKGIKFNNLQIDSIYDIAVNKVHTIVMKPRARDFIDIYFIIQEKKYSLEDLISKAKAKFDWHITALELGARFLEAATLTDYPRMSRKINHREWKEFFVNEAKKLKKGIFK